LTYLLNRGQWYDETPIDPWQRAALGLLLNERAPVSQLVPPPG
jgi:hypothetical protein